MCSISQAQCFTAHAQLKSIAAGKDKEAEADLQGMHQHQADSGERFCGFSCPLDFPAFLRYLLQLKQAILLPGLCMPIGQEDTKLRILIVV